MKKKNTNEVVKNLALVTQLGVSMLAPIVMCAVLGMWLDEKFGWQITAVLLILGILAGARNTWVLIKSGIAPNSKETDAIYHSAPEKAEDRNEKFEK